MALEHHLSIIIPTFNEEQRIRKTLLCILAFLEEQPYETELIVVDDGSTDQTCQVVAETIQGYPYQLLQNQRNLGKGAVVRKGMGKIFNFFVCLMALSHFRDTQCGFKCFRLETARRLFARQKLKGFSFDVEILYLAKRMDYRILESPVTWRNSPASRVRLFCDSFTMLIDLFRIPWLHQKL